MIARTLIVMKGFPLTLREFCLSFRERPLTVRGYLLTVKVPPLTVKVQSSMSSSLSCNFIACVVKVRLFTVKGLS